MAVKTRLTASEIEVQNAAEREIMRFKDSLFLWCRHVLDVHLNPHQRAWATYFEREANSMLVGSRRIQKSFLVSMFLLKEGATKSGAEINIHSPTLEQSKRNLRYMTDRIVESEMLMAFIERRIGEGLGREHVNFRNRSQIQAKGQASSTDGLGATHQWLEEFDDMDWEVFLTRIFPTGSQIKPDFDYGVVDGCRRIVTGTIKGRGNLYRLEHPDADVPFNFTVLPKLDCWYGVAAGIIPESDVVLARDVLMTPAQFARTYLALYTESREYYPTSAIRACEDPTTVPIEPIEGRVYVGSGPVAVGIDYEGHGDGEGASQTTITFVEQAAPGQFVWLWGKEWDVGSPPDEVKADMMRALRFFRPSLGAADAYDPTFTYELCKEMKAQGLTTVDVRGLQSKAGKGGWDDWPIRPTRFSGRAKHQLYKRLQSLILTNSIAVPLTVDGDPSTNVVARFKAQLENVKARESAEGYDVFELIRKAIGDDHVASTALAVGCHKDETARPTRAAGGGSRMGGFRRPKTFAQKSFKRMR